MKQVVVTGASSLVGTALIDECVKHNVGVLALVRRNSEKTNRISRLKNLTISECDLNDIESFSYSGSEKFDVFYHFGWSHTDKAGRQNPSEQCENIKFSLDAVKLAHRLGCSKFIGAGSQAEYGIHVSEKTSPDSPLYPREAYGAAKAAAGKLCSIEAERLNMNFAWVRIFSLYGKYELESTLIQTAMRKMLADEKCGLTPCTHNWDYLYSADAGEALFALGNALDGNRVYCLGSGSARALREYIEEMKAVLGSKSELGFGDIPYSDPDFNGFCADISDLTRDTGWKPRTPFRDGIAAEAERISRQINSNVNRQF